MEEDYFKKVLSSIILLVLIVLAFFMLRPILLSIILGILLAFVVSPVFLWLNKKIKIKSISILIITILLLLLIILPIWFFTPTIIDQSLKIYSTTKTIDFVEPLKKIFPPLFASDDFSREIGSIIYSFVNRTVNSFSESLVNIILDFPTLLLQLFVVFFTFFFVLRDQDQMVSYIQSLLPFSKEVEKKLFEQTKGITISVLYGQIIIGVIQGLVTGMGFFLFGINNAMLLTFLAVFAGVFPIIGTTIIWLPVAIFALVAGSTFSAIGVTVFGLISIFIDNFLKPIFVSRRTSLPSSIILIGMVGGFLLFGIIGFILGPLILAYLLIILEVYRNKRVPGILIQGNSSKLKITI